jgi:hypothetical protein
MYLQEEVSALKHKNAQQAEELRVLDWYMKFVEKGYDMRKIASDYDNAIRKVVELKAENLKN